MNPPGARTKASIPSPPSASFMPKNDRSQGRIQVRHIGLHQELQDRNERGYDDDVGRDTDLVGDHLGQKRDEYVGENEDESSGETHSHTVYRGGSGTDGGTHTEHEDKRRIILDDAVGYNSQFTHIPLF